MRAIGLKNINVLQPINAEILGANSPSWPVLLNYSGFALKMIRLQVDLPTIKTFPPKGKDSFEI